MIAGSVGAGRPCRTRGISTKPQRTSAMRVTLTPTDAPVYSDREELATYFIAQEPWIPTLSMI